jgi:hypothetical protein
VSVPTTGRRGTFALAIVVAATLLDVAPAAANPFYIGRFGGLRADAVMDGAFGLYWNPAGLARKGWDVALDATLIARQATFDRDPALNNVGPDEVAVNAGIGRSTSVSVVPALVGRYGLSRGPIDLGFALGVFVDIAGSGRWEHNDKAPAMFPGAVDGPQRWGSIAASLTVYSLAASIALRHRPTGLSLGITPILDIVRFSTTRALDLDGTDDLVDPAGRLKEGRALFDGRTVNGRFILGARWDYHTPSGWDRYSLGLSWRHGARYDVEGTLDLAVGTSPPSSQAARLTLPIADVLMLAGSIGVTRRVVLRPSIEWGIWRILDEHRFVSAADGTVLMRFQRNFVDSVAGRVRADVLVHDRVQVQAGLGFERGATPASTHEPGLGENHNLEVGVGVVAALSHRVDLTSALIVQYFLPRTVTDSVQRPSENGRYTDTREFFTLHLEVHGWRPFVGESR